MRVMRYILIICICQFSLAETAYAMLPLHNFEWGMHGNASTILAVNDSYANLGMGYGGGSQVRFVENNYYWGMGVDYYWHNVHWAPHGHSCDHIYLHSKNAQTLEIYPEIGYAMPQRLLMKLHISFAPFVSRSNISNLDLTSFDFDFNNLKPHKWKPGLNFGLSFEFPKNRKTSFEVGAKYHFMFTKWVNTRFLTIFGGVIL